MTQGLSAPAAHAEGPMFDSQQSQCSSSLSVTLVPAGRNAPVQTPPTRGTHVVHVHANKHLTPTK